jgi:hypothetical protein
VSKYTPTIRDAEAAIKCTFSAPYSLYPLEYDPRKVVETERWWYIPAGWIGCFGFIVNKTDLYVNQLGSGGPDLTFEIISWGHDHGIFNDLVDFCFCPDTDRTLVAHLISSGFKHIHPNAEGDLPRWSVPYRDSEIPAAIARQFPKFSRHNVWLALRELHKAYQEGLRFSSTLSKA